MYKAVLYIPVKCLGRRKVALVVVLVAWGAAVAAACWLAALASGALLPPPPPDQDLTHYRRNRSLQHYLVNIQLLIEPSSTPCSGVDEVALVALVATAPSRYDHRAVIRQTWAKHQPTYFVLGVDGDGVDENLVDIYLEAKQHSDMIVWDFRDHYQNLTLKTALMLQWTLDRCPQARFLYKIDDDVLLNPWRLRHVLEERKDDHVMGYKMVDNVVHRDEYTKWYMPRWLYPEETIPEYLSGPGYIINTYYLKKIMRTAKTVPLINLEDVYFTYLVCKKALGLELSHDTRLSVFKPWLPVACSYWELATTHSFTPEEMETAWRKIENIAKYNSDCRFYNYLSVLFWY